MTISADGVPIDGIFPVAQPFPYPISFTVDTRRLDNGTHYLQVSDWWRVPSTNTFDSPTVQVDGVNGDSVLVYVTNNTCYPNWVTDVGETNMLFKITCLPTNIDWQVDVFGAVGDYIRSFTNHSGDGLIDFSWDLRDTNGALRDDLTFSSVTTVHDLTSNTTATATNPPSVKRPDNFPSVGLWVVARSDMVEHDFAHFSDWTNAINTIAQMGEEGGGVIPTTGRNFGEAYLVELGNLTNWGRMVRAFTNGARNFYWFGHGTPNEILDGDVGLASSFVAELLHNQAPATNNTRYRFVWIDGCSSALGTWPAAFGLGNRENVPRESYTVRPGAFAGYSQMVYGYGGHLSVTLAACYYRSNLAFYWSMQNRGIKDAFDTAAGLSGFTQAQYLKLYGLWDLHWTEYNHKENWPP